MVVIAAVVIYMVVIAAVVIYMVVIAGCCYNYSGISVSDEVLNRANPLLVVNHRSNLPK